MRQWEVRLGWEGWIAPDGTTYPSPSGDHAEEAIRLLSEVCGMPEDDVIDLLTDPDDELIRRGWALIHLCGTEGPTEFASMPDRPTPAQLRFVGGWPDGYGEG